MTMDAALQEFTDTVLDALARGELVKLTLTKPTPTAGDIASIDIRPIMVKRQLKLSFTTHHRTRDVVKNYPPHEAAAIIATHAVEHFQTARCQTITGDLTLLRRDGHFTLSRHAASITSAPPLAHDRAKHRLISTDGKPYLHALGITDAKGEVYKNTQDKYRQINKYIETLDALLRQLPGREPLRIVDMGAGKGYLTFALYDHITHRLKQRVELVGVDARAELVAQCNAIARDSGFTGLSFVEGSIARYDCTGVDGVIALHACDTATDDAIARAVQAHAAFIVVAPCCHKQVRNAMGKPAANHPLAATLRHGTYHERMAEMLTDSIRAQLMERAGYRTKLFEFIADAHTPKNVMIVGVREEKPISQTAVDSINASINATKAQFGIAIHQLEHLLKA